MKRKYITSSLILCGTLICTSCGKETTTQNTESVVAVTFSQSDTNTMPESVTTESVENESTSNESVSSETVSVTLNEEEVPSSVVSASKYRDNTTVCLIPEASGITVYSNSVTSIDASNISEGYVCVSYFGTCKKVKLQITKGSNTTYTYNLTAGKGFEVFPLSDGSGTYTVTVYENVYDNQYAVALSQNIDATITNKFGPNLYPNQYVNFNKNNIAITKASELAKNCSTDLDVVTSIYNYVVSHISYDYNKAASVQSGYTCDIDKTMKSGTGICLDYASVLCSMLRSQRIPTRLEVGYAGTAYHAWISTYIDDIGWVNGMIEFDGTNWKIMDPTFASTTDPETLKNFLDDSSNYQTKYIY